MYLVKLFDPFNLQNKVEVDCIVPSRTRATFNWACFADPLLKAAVQDTHLGVAESVDDVGPSRGPGTIIVIIDYNWFVETNTKAFHVLNEVILFREHVWIGRLLVTAIFEVEEMCAVYVLSLEFRLRARLLLRNGTVKQVN